MTIRGILASSIAVAIVVGALVMLWSAFSPETGPSGETRTSAQPEDGLVAIPSPPPPAGATQDAGLTPALSKSAGPAPSDTGRHSTRAPGVDVPPVNDPAAEEFRAELDSYVRDGREPEFIARVASALERGDHSAETRWNIYVLRFIGTAKVESVLHEALGIEVRKGLPDLDDRLSVVASAFDALEDIVGREERIDIQMRYVQALDDAIAHATVPHVAIHAARIHLAHAENREEAERHLARLLGEDRSWILDIDDRTPTPPAPSEEP